MATEPPRVKRKGKNVFLLDLPIQRNRSWERWFLLSGDRHWDNPHSDWGLQEKHLKECEEKDAYVIDIGDFFCAMQGKYDPRSSKADVRPEHANDHYLDSLVSTATDFFEPYAHRFLMIASGNHERNIQKRHETSLVDRFVNSLNGRAGSSVAHGGWGGWFRFTFHDNAFKTSVNMHYSHGYGGGGPVTKGTIQTARRSSFLPDADLVLSGHIHERWNLDVQRVRLSRHGAIFHDTQTHICVPTYKEEFGSGGGDPSWHVERGAPPKPLGAAWLRFHYIRTPGSASGATSRQRVAWDVTWAE